MSNSLKGLNIIKLVSRFCDNFELKDNGFVRYGLESILLFLLPSNLLGDYRLDMRNIKIKLLNTTYHSHLSITV